MAERELRCATFLLVVLVACRAAPLNRICWGFRNWHPDKGRHAILLITFRAPKQ